MVQVHLWAGLRRFTGGSDLVEVEAANVAGMLAALGAAHPGLAPLMEGGVSVVIDGTIVPNRFAPVSPASEIYLIQRVKGG